MHSLSTRSSWHLPLRERNKNPVTSQSKHNQKKANKHHSTPNKICHCTSPGKKSQYFKTMELLSPIILPVISSLEQDPSLSSLNISSPLSKCQLFVSPLNNLNPRRSTIFKHKIKIKDAPKEAALKLLLDRDIIHGLIDVLDKENMLEHYMLLVKQLVSGDFPVTNIAVLAALERAKLQSLKTTCAMKYHPRYRQFFEVIYRIIKGKGIWLLSGSKHKGQCLQHKISVYVQLYFTFMSFKCSPVIHGITTFWT